ncbi:MAG: low-specificity L-threonine aldolase [Dehalococcoidia bacterium]
MIDLRSDTVTMPNKDMRKAMYDSEVGDDVYGEDPTVNKLQEIASEVTGKEDSLLVASGTMGNLVSLLTLTNRGEEIILGNKCHVYAWEGSGVSIYGGISMKIINNNDDGSFDINELARSINPLDDHKPKTSTISIENTHNQCGGSPLTQDFIENVKLIADKNNLKIHMDGARLFNASVSQRKSVKEIVKNVDSVTFCLSKGLSCPIGSIISGSKSFINEARRWRKSIGGGMRQAGVIAAAGIYAFDNMIDRLEEDHLNAKNLAIGLSKIPEIIIDTEYVKTNILRFELTSKVNLYEFESELKKEGIIFNSSYGSIRMVTHYGINSKDIKDVIEKISKVVKYLI